MRHVTLFLLAFFLTTSNLIGGPGGGDTTPDDQNPAPDPDPTQVAPEFVRGDVDQDGKRDLGDVSELISFLFNGSRYIRCLDTADADDDGVISVSDITYLSAFLSSQGPPPPFPTYYCGRDLTEDGLLECEYEACYLWMSDFYPGDLNPLWENWFLWVYGYGDVEKLASVIDDARADDPALARAVQTNELEMVLRVPDRIVLLTPKNEEEALLWIAENQKELARRTAPIHLFLQEERAGAALLEKLIDGGR